MFMVRAAMRGMMRLSSNVLSKKRIEKISQAMAKVAPRKAIWKGTKLKAPMVAIMMASTVPSKCFTGLSGFLSLPK